MSSLASYYANNKQPEKGIELCKEGIALAKKSGLSSQLLMVYHSLAENYKASGNTAEYSKTLEAIIALKDSFNNINSSKLLADMQSSSEAVKSEETIAEQKLNLTKKNYWLFGSAIFAILAGIIIWLAFKNYRRKQSIKMELALEEEKRIAAQSIIDAEEHERKRIAADLHDNIGAYATAIRADVEKIVDTGFEKNNNSLQNLQQHSQEIIDSLRDTIWVLNKDNITITGISDRIKNYISKLRPTYDNIQFHINEEIRNDVRISSQHALNMFRIIQEAIHNALKHGEAANININISSNEAILIEVSDDGKGMPLHDATEGNGLINMKARAREIGMQLSIVSKTNEGTTLTLVSNTN
jgi:signal transduction histidine kinase